MSTDFHALCTELLQPLAEYDDANPYHEHRALIARARAALDQAPAAGPTDEQIADLIVPDTRRPGALLPPLTLRLQPALVADLDGHAARLGCSRVALVRTLLAQEVAKLKDAMPVDQEADRQEGQADG